MIATGKVDREGRLVAADARLLQLHLAAGGIEGGAIAVPQIATLARLARNLGILVSRPVTAAEGPIDLELLVRARPDGDIVDLSIGGWTPLAAIAPSDEMVADRAHDFARLENDGAWETDAELRFTRLSPGLGAQIVANPRNALGQPFGTLFRLVPGDNGELPLLNALANRTGFAKQRAEIQQGNGLEVELSGHLIFDTGGHFHGISGGFKRLNGIDTDRDAPDISPTPADPDFSGRLDAAIRAPLAKVIEDAEMISARHYGPVRQEYAGYAQDIAAASRHLLGLADDLSDLQAIERVDFHVDADTLDLADIARRAAGLLAVRASGSKIRIDAPDADEVLMVTGEFRRLLQILVNLVGNAVRYSPEGGMVWVRSEEEGDLAAIIVADMGKGIAEEDQERIFEKFERVDPAEPGGSGLGLYIARRLARAMGGDISVDSAPGRGARFVLTVPRAPV